ncbi:MAG TPA: asparagine--tRNA ligase [Candidatus Bipolaricaulis sp.]|nr:asparagine--tRNA ligase [Candidatus Bipolaricaulis sp.]HRS14565.1 asparagine--tRNA ligase [Candidatus Bipolaricaulis sp.]HRU22281.1 asparagine--tRNA ligase [Candidatus Bipolaricaulis sp.]
MRPVYIEELGQHVGSEVLIQGWLYNKRSSGKVRFVLVRDGTGLVQGVVTPTADPAAFALADSLPQEASLRMGGTVRAEPRAPGGFEVAVTHLEPVHIPTAPFPIGLKEHGPGFLMDHRHLWIRSRRQTPILRLRDAVLWAIRSFFHERGFVATEAPVLVGTAVEGTTTLFPLDYFGTPAYLSQSGQLYLEATCAALGKVYWIGPVFRAEKSKTRRHLTEFWMAEAEQAFLDHEGNLALQEDLVRYVVESVVAERPRDLGELERDPSLLRREVAEPFARVTYHEAVALVQAAGVAMEVGDDFGAPAEDALSQHFGRPVFVERFPAAIKPFYMKHDPMRPDLALCADLIAPEGYGEIIGGSQRVDREEELLAQLREAGLPEDPYRWYLDLRRWGAVPHSGFGLGVERTVQWIAGIPHIREAIPFPRTLDRLYP